MSKTKIVVIHLKEIIYTALFAGLGILLIILLVIMFLNKKDDSQPTMSTSLYRPGVYNSTIMLNDTSLNLKIVVDTDHINSIEIVNIDEAIATMYPLVEPSLEALSEQLYNDVSIEDLVITEDSKYTQKLLIEAIELTLEKAAPVTKEK